MIRCRILHQLADNRIKWPSSLRAFSLATCLHEKALPPRRKISEDEITEAFLKGSGPGGQKINKTSSAVQLKHIPTGIVVKCQETRSREQNRKMARQVLGEKLDQMEKGEESRMALKAERARGKKASAEKKKKRKYRKLEELKNREDFDGVAEEDRVKATKDEGIDASNGTLTEPIENGHGGKNG